MARHPQGTKCNARPLHFHLHISGRPPGSDFSGIYALPPLADFAHAMLMSCDCLSPCRTLKPVSYRKPKKPKSARTITTAPIIQMMLLGIDGLLPPCRDPKAVHGGVDELTGPRSQIIRRVPRVSSRPHLSRRGGCVVPAWRCGLLGRFRGFAHEKTQSRCRTSGAQGRI